MSGEARWAALKREDAQTRLLAVTEFSRPLLVEAGAGTGKTALLVARILAWSLGPGWQQAEVQRLGTEQEVAGAVASGVVAITFTEKAAAEMSTRLAEGLGQILAGGWPLGLPPEHLPPPEVARNRARFLLAALDRYVLCTIHAFALRLLARHPLEAGMSPAFQVDPQGLGVYRTVEQVVAAFLADPDPSLVSAWQKVARAGITPTDLSEVVVRVLEQGVGPELLERAPLEAQYRRLAEELQATLEALAGVVAPLAGQARLKKARELWELASHWSSPTGEPRRFLEEVVAAVGAQRVIPKLKDWARGSFAEAEKATLGDEAGHLEGLSKRFLALVRAAEASQPDHLEPFLHLAHHFVAQARERLDQAGVVTYQDLLVRAVKLFEEHPAVARAERARIKQLLVDEFQDTDRWQGRLVDILAFGGDTLGPGLFLVGDPKQSIYGWRSADLAVYEDFKEKVKSAGGEVCPLVVNFRSVPGILEEVTRVIRPLMKEEPGVQPAFQELVPFRSGAEATGFVRDRHRPVEYWVCWRFSEGLPEGETLLGESREIEARALARHLRELHDGFGVLFSHMACLLRAFSDADILLEAFRRQGIPYATTHDPAYFQRREVLDAACLLQAVADRHDEVALVGFLRSAWAGIPDAAWWGLKSRGFFSLVAELYGVDAARLAQVHRMLLDVARELPEDVPGKDRIRGWEQAAFWALTCLGVLRQSFHEDPADVFVARVRSWLLPEATEAARFPGRPRIANLERFFRFLLRELGNTASWELARVVRRAVDEVPREGEARPLETEDAVLVTTIHQAKGLDFPFVFLVDVGRARPHRSGGGVGAWLLRHAQGGDELVLRAGPLVTPNVVFLEDLQERVAAAESVRLLYVAVTRAKDRLVISGNWPVKTGNGSLGELLLSREGLPDPQTVAVSLEGSDRVEKGGVLWVFPALSLSAEDEAATSSPSPLPLASIGKTVQELEEAQQQADLRQQLPFGAPVSAEAHHQLREVLASGEATVSRKQSGAALAGTLVHRALEHWDFTNSPQEELVRQRSLLATYLPPGLEARDATQGLEKAQLILDRFSQSPLFGEFCSLFDAVMGREVPVLLAADGVRAAGFLSGAIDLIYRNHRGLVVVDFKTDAVEGDEVKARAQVYRSQVSLYAQAVREALRLERLPRFELWFLWCGEKVVFAGEELS